MDRGSHRASPELHPAADLASLLLITLESTCWPTSRCSSLNLAFIPQQEPPGQQQQAADGCSLLEMGLYAAHCPLQSLNWKSQSRAALCGTDLHPLPGSHQPGSPPGALESDGSTTGHTALLCSAQGSIRIPSSPQKDTTTAPKALLGITLMVLFQNPPLNQQEGRTAVIPPGCWLHRATRGPGLLTKSGQASSLYSLIHVKRDTFPFE